VLRQPLESALRTVITVQDGARRRHPRACGHGESIIDEHRFITAVNCPTDYPSGVQVQNDTAVEGSLPGLVLGDVGKPQGVGGRRSEVAVHKVLAGGNVDQVAPTFLPRRESAETLGCHDPPDQLSVDDEAAVVK
jgi:hypothetical protein